jgi:hypothetical protein
MTNELIIESFGNSIMNNEKKPMFDPREPDLSQDARSIHGSTDCSREVIQSR